jgi:hypothetical protein
MADKATHDQHLVAGLKDLLYTLEGHQDAVLLEYIMVLLGTGKGEAQVVAELDTFMSCREHAERLVRWLFSAMAGCSSSTGTSTGTTTATTRSTLKSVVVVAAGASVHKPSTINQPRSNTRHLLRSVLDGVVKSNSTIVKSLPAPPAIDQRSHCRDARDIINGRRRDDPTGRSHRHHALSTVPNDSMAQKENTANSSPLQPVQPQLKTQRCPAFPACAKPDDECPFAHPKELCKYFPNCMFGKACLFVHPPVPCRFGDRCQNDLCNYSHSTGCSSSTSGAGTTSTGSSTSTTSTSSTPILTTINIPCKFNERCTRPACPFLHTVPLPCPHGSHCLRPACPFTHPTDHAGPIVRAMVNRPCRFGRACAKADCPFQHPPKLDGTMVASGVANSSGGGGGQNKEP